MKENKIHCKYQNLCGGCDYIGMPYEKQLQRKQKRVEELLAPAQRRDHFRVEPVVGAEHPLYYRNKVHAVFAPARGGRVLRGIYQKGSHHVVDVKGCYLEDQKADAIMEEIRQMLPSFHLHPYDEDQRRGFLRHVLIRVASSGIMVVLVTAAVPFPGKNNFIMALRKKFPEITTIVQNINDKRTSMVLGDRNIVLYGKGYVTDDRLGLSFRISPSSFFQINTEQTVKLYGFAKRAAGLTGKETVLDTYCGTGTIGMFLADAAKQVIGVELNPAAVRDAITNAKRNGVRNIRFIRQDATAYMEELAAQRENAGQIDVLCMDPPRSGSTPRFIRAAASLHIPRVVYISCEPETLARDLLQFQKQGYRVERVVPVDMFPQTKNIETVCLLSNRKSKPDSYIEVPLDMEGYYKIKDHGKEWKKFKNKDESGSDGQDKTASRDKKIV